METLQKLVDVLQRDEKSDLPGNYQDENPDEPEDRQENSEHHHITY